MNKLIEKLGIDETYTKPIKKPVFDSVKNNTYPQGGYNYMADLLFLPETKKGYKYLFVIVDLWSNAFDIEPLKSKEADEVLKAMQTIFKRKFITKPKASIRTDNGTEFKGVFHKWLHDNNILHREAEPYRHQQLSNVENLNKTLGRFLNGYMNKMEEQTKKVYEEWDEILNILRQDLNKIRILPDGNPFNNLIKPIDFKTPKYKIGDLVIRKVERPLNALGHNQNTTNFRVGDYRWDTKNPRKIKNIYYYPNNIRYVLNTLGHVSYTEAELMPAKQQEETFTVKSIIDKKVENKITYYKIWWKGYKKAESTWEKEVELIKDGLKPMIDRYNN